MADAGVAVTVSPATDLFMMGRDRDSQRPPSRDRCEFTRGKRHNLLDSSNNILNPFTSMGDGNLIRIANLQAKALPRKRSQS
jgi:cytosine/creatinine deaminase